MTAAGSRGRIFPVDSFTILLAGTAILSAGLGSIRFAERLRWRELHRGEWRVLAAAATVFSCACTLLARHRMGALAPAAIGRSALEMFFAACFLCAMAYLLHCFAWVASRFGRRVFLDELFSRLWTLAAFAAMSIAAYAALVALFHL